MTFDPFEADQYRSYLAEFSLTEEQERELLETLWSIMRMFVETGFSVEHCGQLLDEFNDLANSDPGDVTSLLNPDMEAHDDQEATP